MQGRQESNPQPPVLETGALPIELLPCEIDFFHNMNENYLRQQKLSASKDT